MELIERRLESQEMSHIPSSVDSELLAALMDGTLSPADAESLREQIAKADAPTLSAIADAMAIHAEFAQDEQASVESTNAIDLEKKDVGPPIDELASIRKLKIDRPSVKSRWPIAVGALAAAAVIAFFVRENNFSYVLMPQQYGLLTSSAGAGLDRPTWSALRGGTTETPEPTRSIRIGVLLANLGVEAAHQDSIGDNLSNMLSLLAEISGSQPAVMTLQAMQSQPKLTVAQVATISGSTLPLVDENAASLGGYLQSVRIAAAHNDVVFFKKTHPKLLSNFRTIHVDDATKAQIAQLASLINSGSPDLPAIASLSDRVLSALTR